MTASPDTLLEIERIEREAWHDLMQAAPADIAQAHGMRCERMGGALLIAVPGLPAVLFNRAFGLGLQGPPAPGELDRVRAFFAHHKAGTWGAQPALGGGGDAWATALQSAHLRELPMRWAKTARGAHAAACVPRPGGSAAPDIREVGAADAHDYAGPIVRGMGLPPWFMQFSGALAGRLRWRTYAAYDAQGQAVAAAALFIDGTTGWLGTATTEARGRGQGLQRALIARRINDAVTAGCTLICTETGEPQPGQPSPSYHNILASGFEVVGLRRSLTG